MNPNAHPTLEAHLQARLAEIRAAGLWRELRTIGERDGAAVIINGRRLINFSSNDYLGLMQHPRLIEAARAATERFGAGAGASRLICGTLAPHVELEQTIADWKGTEAALAFSCGYSAALGVINALMSKDDILIVDKLVHACVVDAAWLCGARLRVFAHNDLNDLERLLQWADAQRTENASRRILVVTESVFSMDGDLAPLRDIVALKERYGAWLMVDEAHGAGLFGTHRRGLAEEHDVAGQVDIQMGTLGKAIGAAGGFICGSRALIDFLINRARSFIFSTAPVPAQAAAATAGIGLIRSPEGEALVQRLWSLVDRVKTEFIHAGFAPGPVRSPILPLIVGAETAAVGAADRLREKGFLVPAIRYPTVARGSARLRFTVSAAHTADDVAALGRALAELQPAA